MTKPSPLPAVALFALALAACQQTSDSNAADPAAINIDAPADVETLPPSDEAGDPNFVNGLNEADDAGSEDPTQQFIPMLYRGRWGMVAADCTSTRGDNKGLITIGDTSIRFYESLATLKEQRPAIATSFSGLFGFTGEGQTWEKVMTFTRTGDTLKRAEEEGRFTYTRCA